MDTKFCLSSYNFLPILLIILLLLMYTSKISGNEYCRLVSPIISFECYKCDELHSPMCRISVENTVQSPANNLKCCVVTKKLLKIELFPCSLLAE